MPSDYDEAGAWRIRRLNKKIKNKRNKKKKTLTTRHHFNSELSKAWKLIFRQRRNGKIPNYNFHPKFPVQTQNHRAIHENSLRFCNFCFRFWTRESVFPVNSFGEEKFSSHRFDLQNDCWIHTFIYEYLWKCIFDEEFVGYEKKMASLASFFFLSAPRFFFFYYSDWFEKLNILSGHFVVSRGERQGENVRFFSVTLTLGCK